MTTGFETAGAFLADTDANPIEDDEDAVVLIDEVVVVEEEEEIEEEEEEEETKVFSSSNFRLRSISLVDKSEKSNNAISHRLPNTDEISIRLFSIKYFHGNFLIYLEQNILKSGSLLFLHSDK